MLNRFSVIAATLVTASFTMGAVLSAAAPGSAREVVTCESNNGRRNVCPVNARGGVRLAQQLSNASCNGNWGYNRNRIWVTNGCRARFVVNDYGYNNGYNNRYNNGYNNGYNRYPRY